MGVYRILRRVHGQPGVVEAWAGLNPGDAERPVALKRLVEPWAKANGAFFERFMPLAAGRARLPMLNRLLEVGLSEDGVWLVEELDDGETLRVLAQTAATRGVRPAPNEMIAVLARTAAVLAALHESSPVMVHGDLCASTLLVTPAGDVKLLDVGVARAAGSTGPLGPARAEVQTLTPEQLGNRPADPPSDIFRLGLIAQEVVMGRPLFAARDSAEAVAAAQRYEGVQPTSFPGVPGPLAALMARMLARDPLDRPSARDVEGALRRFGREVGWSLEPKEIARLFERVFAGRPALTEGLDAAAGKELVLRPPGSAPSRTPQPAPAPPPARRPSLVMDSAGAPATAPRAATPGGGTEAVPAPSPSAPVQLGRIATRRVTVEELRAIDGADRHERPAPVRDEKLAEQLLKRALLSPEALEQAKATAEEKQLPLADALVLSQVMEDEAVVALLAELTRTIPMSGARLAELPVPRDAVKLLPEHEADLLCAVPVAVKGTRELMVAMREPLDAPTLERLKSVTGAAAIVGVRATERAIRTAIDRFYRGPWSSPYEAWLPSPAPMRLQDVEAPAEPEPAPATALNEVQARLFEALLVLQGEKGWAGQQLLALTCGLAKRLGASPARLATVRFAAAAVIVANLVDGARPFDLPNVGSLSSVLGSAWSDLIDLVGPYVEGEDPPPEEPGALSICAAFTFASVAGTVRPRPVEVARVLDSFRTRYHFSKAVHEALSRELALHSS